MAPTPDQLVGWYTAQYETDGRDVLVFYKNELTSQGPYTITPDAVSWQIHVGKVPGLVYRLTAFEYNNRGQVIHAEGEYHRNGDGPWHFSIDRFASFCPSALDTTPGTPVEQ
jgi:hypothetical protein